MVFAKKPNILVLETLSVAIVQKHTQYFKKHLAQLGVKADIEVFNGQGDAKAIKDFLKQKIEHSKIDLVVTNATVASTVAKTVLQGKDIPVIFMTVADPIGAGLVGAIGVPNKGFITGRVYSPNHATVLKIMDKIFRHKKQIEFGVVATDYPSNVLGLKNLKSLFKNYPKFTMHEIFTPHKHLDSKELLKLQTTALKNAKLISNKIDYFWSLNGPLYQIEDFIIQLHAIKPIAYGVNIKAVKNGALFSVAPDPYQTGLEVAEIVKKVLEGKKPSEIAVTIPEKVSFSLNITTANKLGLLIPSDLLDLAGKNVYQ